MAYEIKNWQKFQHYKNRRPPWIKIHRTLLDDREYLAMPIHGRAIAPLIWLMASEAENGTLDMSVNDIAWRLRLPEKEVAAGVADMVKCGFLIADGEQKPKAQAKPKPAPKEKKAKGPPTFEEWEKFCKSKGFGHIARKSFDYYESNNWKDVKGNKIKSWKQRLISVWFDKAKNPTPPGKAPETDIPYERPF